MRWLLAALLAVCFAVPVHAQATICMDRAEMVRILNVQYGETRLGFGKSQRGYLLEIYVSPDGTGWTLISTSARGVSCIVDAGDAMRVRYGAIGVPA